MPSSTREYWFDIPSVSHLIEYYFVKNNIQSAATCLGSASVSDKRLPPAAVVPLGKGGFPSGDEVIAPYNARAEICGKAWYCDGCNFAVVGGTTRRSFPTVIAASAQSSVSDSGDECVLTPFCDSSTVGRERSRTVPYRW